MFFSHKGESLNPHQQTHQLPLPLERRARTLYKGMYVVVMYIPCILYVHMYVLMYVSTIILCALCIRSSLCTKNYPSLENLQKMESNGHFWLFKTSCSSFAVTHNIHWTRASQLYHILM